MNEEKYLNTKNFAICFESHAHSTKFNLKFFKFRTANANFNN